MLDGLVVQVQARRGHTRWVLRLLSRRWGRGQNPRSLRVRYAVEGRHGRRCGIRRRGHIVGGLSRGQERSRKRATHEASEGWRDHVDFLYETLYCVREEGNDLGYTA